MNDLTKAINMLKYKYGVIPEKYTMYNGAYLFLAYPPNVKNKDSFLSPYYLVDLKDKVAGSFSPAFDIAGFFKAMSQAKDI